MQHTVYLAPNANHCQVVMVQILLKSGIQPIIRDVWGSVQTKDGDFYVMPSYYTGPYQSQLSGFRIFRVRMNAAGKTWIIVYDRGADCCGCLSEDVIPFDKLAAVPKPAGATSYTPIVMAREVTEEEEEEEGLTTHK